MVRVTPHASQNTLLTHRLWSTVRPFGTRSTHTRTHTSIRSDEDGDSGAL